MLNITFKYTQDVIDDVDNYFNFNYEDEWLLDSFVKQMIQSVDRSEVLDSQLIKSPVLGLISPEKLSGGVKALILMYKRPQLKVWATACGDNCAEWILRIGNMQDITIVLEHIMDFPYDFHAVCLDNGKKIENLSDYRRCVLDCLIYI